MHNKKEATTEYAKMRLLIKKIVVTNIQTSTQSISYPITWQIILTIRSISTPDLKYFLGAMLLSTSTCPAYWTSLRTLSAGLRSSAILMF